MTVIVQLIPLLLIVIAYYFLIYRRSVKHSSDKDSVWAGYGGIDMTSQKGHTTRFLCASAFLLGTSYRQKILKYLKDRNMAVAPEPGVDLGLVAQVCIYAERVARKYYVIFPVLLVATLLIGALTNPSIAAVVLIVTTVPLYFYKEYRVRRDFIPAFSLDTFDVAEIRKKCPAELPENIRASIPAADQNLIVYRAFSPFVGAGLSLGGWSFAINVEKPKEEAGQSSVPMPVQIPELYDVIQDSMNAAGLVGLSAVDTFFVHGADIRKDSALLPNAFGRPLQHLDRERASAYMNGSDPRIRHYKWIRVQDWGDELAVSYFLRCALRGSNMFVEINRYLLTPLSARYRKIDSLPRDDWRHKLGLAFWSLIVATFYPYYCIVVLLGNASEFWQTLLGGEERARNREIRDNPMFNYGCGRALRESFSSDRFVHYFQKLDGDFYNKVLEREILDAIITYLDDHNIDTSELKERQSTILNSGIIVQGGDVKAESLAVGTGAQAIKAASTEPSRTKHAAKGAV